MSLTQNAVARPDRGVAGPPKNPHNPRRLLRFLGPPAPCATAVHPLRYAFCGILCVVLLPACGIVRSSTGIAQAERALREAEEAKAESVAPYELTLAQQYLQKAREEQAYNAYYSSEALAVASQEFAKKAYDIAAHGRPKKGTGGLVDKKSMEALPEQGEVEQQRQQQESQEKVIQTGPAKVLDEDVDVLDTDKKKKDEEKKEDGASGSSGGGQ